MATINQLVRKPRAKQVVKSNECQKPPSQKGRIRDIENSTSKISVPF